MSNASTLPWLALALGLLLGPSAEAGLVTSEVPSYAYGDSKLLLRIPTAESATALIKVRELSRSGRFGKEKKKKARLEAGVDSVELSVGEGEAHLVEVELGKRVYRVFASRGKWTVGERGLLVDQVDQGQGFDTQKTAPRDVVLDRGFRAVVTRGDGESRLEVGRSFGRADGFGLPTKGYEGVVLVLGGSAGPMRVTLADRDEKGRTREWDYWLDVGSDFRRYVIPLRAFVGRGRAGKPDRLSEIRLRSAGPANKGAALEVDLVGLVHKTPRLAGARKKGGRWFVRLDASKPVQERAVLHVDNAQGGEPQTLSFDAKGNGTVEQPESRRYWMCYAEETGAETCDPPDAPQSAYELPVDAGDPIVVDDFERRVPVNRARQADRLRASKQNLRRSFRARRSGGELHLIFSPGGVGDFIDYDNLVPRGAASAKTLEVFFRGKLPSETVGLGLRDTRGRVARVQLGDYLRELDAQSWDRALVPLAAIRSASWDRKGRPRSLGRPFAVTIRLTALESGRELELEVDNIRFIPDRARLWLARFDGAGVNQTSLGGPVRATREGTAEITVTSTAAGLLGRGLSVELRPGRGSARAILELGRLDASSYDAVSFALRAERGVELPHLRFRSGKKTSTVPLDRYVKVSTEWQEVKIPLSDFSVGVDRRKLSSLELEWRAGVTRPQRVDFDDFALE